MIKKYGIRVVKYISYLRDIFGFSYSEAEEYVEAFFVLLHREFSETPAISSEEMIGLVWLISQTKKEDSRYIMVDGVFYQALNELPDTSISPRRVGG